MKEFKDWDTDSLYYLYRIMDTANAIKNTTLSKILDELSDLRELLSKITVTNIQSFLKKITDEIEVRAKKDLGDQEKT